MIISKSVSPFNNEIWSKIRREEETQTKKYGIHILRVPDSIESNYFLC